MRSTLVCRYAEITQCLSKGKHGTDGTKRTKELIIPQARPPHRSTRQTHRRHMARETPPPQTKSSDHPRPNLGISMLSAQTKGNEQPSPRRTPANVHERPPAAESTTRQRCRRRNRRGSQSRVYTRIASQARVHACRAKSHRATERQSVAEAAPSTGTTEERRSQRHSGIHTRHARKSIGEKLQQVHLLATALLGRRKPHPWLPSASHGARQPDGQRQPPLAARPGGPLPPSTAAPHVGSEPPSRLPLQTEKMPAPCECASQ